MIFTGPGIVHPWAITAGPDGALWFTNSPDDTEDPMIGRISIDGRVRTFISGKRTLDSAVAITVGPDGALWFTDQGAASWIGRIGTRGGIRRYDLEDLS